MCAAGAGAQRVAVTVGGQPVENGGSVSSYVPEVVDLSYTDKNNNLIKWVTVQLMAELYATAPETGEYTVLITNTTKDFQNGMPKPQVCWPSTCQVAEPGGQASSTGTLQKGVATDMKIESSMIDSTESEYIDKPFTITFTVDIIPAGNETDTFTCYYTMNYDPAVVGAVEAIEGEAGPVKYYDMQGRTVANPEKGQLVIERQGAKAVKKIVR